MTRVEPSSPGFPSAPARPPPRIDNWFFAFRPDSSARDAAARRRGWLFAEQGIYGRPVKAENFHVSLAGFGWHPGRSRKILDAVRATAAAVVAPPFAVTLDRARCFQGARGKALVLSGGEGVSAARNFHHLLARAMIQHGLGHYVARRQFTPHLTLLYTPQPIAECAVEPVSWTVTEFVLVHSLVGQGRHLIAGRWPLRG